MTARGTRYAAADWRERTERVERKEKEEKRAMAKAVKAAIEKPAETKTINKRALIKARRSEHSRRLSSLPQFAVARMEQSLVRLGKLHTVDGWFSEDAEAAVEDAARCLQHLDGLLADAEGGDGAARRILWLLNRLHLCRPDCLLTVAAIAGIWPDRVIVSMASVRNFIRALLLKVELSDEPERELNRQLTGDTKPGRFPITNAARDHGLAVAVERARRGGKTTIDGAITKVAADKKVEPGMLREIWDLRDKCAVAIDARLGSLKM